jgi:hypothetical protein
MNTTGGTDVEDAQLLVRVFASMFSGPQPIEMAFSKLSAHDCRFGARTFDANFIAISDI